MADGNRMSTATAHRPARRWQRRLGLAIVFGPISLVVLLALTGVGSTEGGTMALVLLAYGAIVFTLFAGLPFGIALITGSLSWSIPLVPMAVAIAATVVTSQMRWGLAAGILAWILLERRHRALAGT